jgi:hypothetical protein
MLGLPPQFGKQPRPRKKRLEVKFAGSGGQMRTIC